jgi:CHASE2 domain-containing sensor protein
MNKNSNGDRFEENWPLLDLGDKLFIGGALLIFAAFSIPGGAIGEVAVDKRSWPRLLLVLGVFASIGLLIYGSRLLIQAGAPIDLVIGAAVALTFLIAGVLVAALFRMVYERKDKDDNHKKK